MPSTFDGLMKIKSAVGTPDEDTVLQAEFPGLESQSVDYGIMEKASDIYTLAGNFGWDDVGSWLAVGRIKENDDNGNVVNGNVVTVNTQNCVIEGAEKLIATVGLRDMIVVDTTLSLHAVKCVSRNLKFTQEVSFYSEFLVVCHNSIIFKMLIIVVVLGGTMSPVPFPLQSYCIFRIQGL